MKRFLFIICCVLTLSYTACRTVNRPTKAKLEKITEDKKNEIVDKETATKAKEVIKQWAQNEDGFLHTASDPHILEKKVSSASEALSIIKVMLLDQSGNFRKEDNDSKICKYESDQLRVYYTETENVYTRTIVIFNLNNNPEVYILVLKK